MTKRLFICGMLLYCISSNLAHAASHPLYVPMRVLISAGNTYTTGQQSLNQRINVNSKPDVQGIALLEPDRIAHRIGIDPFPNVLGYTHDQPSLYTVGLDTFFQDFSLTRKAYPSKTLLAGTVSIPGYFWTGIPFRDLVSHGMDRHLLTLGVEYAAQINALPSYQLRHARGSTRFSMVFWCSLSLIVMIYLFKHRKRGLVLLVFASLTAFTATLITFHWPDADAAFIKAAHQQDLMVIWPDLSTRTQDDAARESSDHLRQFPSPTADAFVVMDAHDDAITRAGGMWDVYLMDYMIGLHDYPIWAVSSGSHHPMDVWVKQKTPKAWMNAMRRGRLINWQMPDDRHLHVDELWLEDVDGEHYFPGDTLHTDQDVTLHIAISESNPKANKHLLNIQIIVDAAVESTIRVQPSHDVKVHRLHLDAGAHVIRVRMPEQQDIRMESNPFFVQIPI